jgi:hypothetical protein
VKCLWVSYQCDDKFHELTNAILKHNLKEENLDLLFQNLKQNLKSIPEENEVVAVD